MVWFNIPLGHRARPWDNKQSIRFQECSAGQSRLSTTIHQVAALLISLYTDFIDLSDFWVARIVRCVIGALQIVR